MEIRLRMIYPNPRPGRHRSQEAKAERREKRKQRRSEKRLQRATEDEEARGKQKDEVVVVTWNVQRMSMGERSKRKVRAVVEFARKEG